MKSIDVINIYKETINNVASNVDNWLSFLNCASWNFKYNFDDQILIYAQRQNATACASMDIWNKKLKRWIKKNSKAIFINNEDENSKFQYRMVFDVADTYNYKGTPYKLWVVKQEYENEIIETLSNSFGEVDSKDSLSQAIKISAYNMVVDSFQDYLATIQTYKVGTDLENVSDEEIKNIFIPTLYASVSYMLMKRCGIEPDIEKSEFSFVSKFNNENIVTILGTATSDIAEIGLREIARTVINLQKEEKNQNRTFVKKQNLNYDNSKENNERGKNYGRDRLQTTSRLYDTKYEFREGETSDGQVRTNEIEIPKTTQESRIYNIVEGKEIGTTLGGDTGTSNTENKSNSTEISKTGEHERKIEIKRTNEMGNVNEQLQDNSRGTSNEGIDLQLNLLTENEQKQNIAEAENASVFFEPLNTFYFPQDIIDSILQDGNGVINGKFRIYHHLIQGLSTDENIKFLKNEYGIGGYSKGGLRIDFNAKGIQLKESELSKMTLSWKNVEKRLQELISMDRYFSEYEKDQYNDWLDANEILNNDNHKDIVKDEDYKLAERLNILIKNNDLYRYMGNIPLEDPEGDNTELILADINDSENIKEYINILKTALNDITSNDEFTKETKSLILELENKLPNYEFVVGDNIYIGIDEYEIRAIDDEKVTLVDIRFPIMTKEMAKEDLENIIKDNPENDRLRTGKRIKVVNEDIWQINSTNEMSTNNTEKIVQEKPLVDRLHKFLNEYDIYDVDEVTLDEVKDTLNDKQKILDTVDYFYSILDSEDILDDFAKELSSFIKELSELYETKDKKQTEILQDLKEEKIKINVKKKRRNKIEYFDLHPEISLKDRNNYSIDNNDLGVGTPKEKFRRNIDAIKILKQCTEENRYATLQEQDVLAQYVGWGGLADVFDSRKDNWIEEYKELKNLLTEKEYEEARTSSLTAFYTPPIVINAIYNALNKMGLERGNLLEPACRYRKFYGNVA